MKTVWNCSGDGTTLRLELEQVDWIEHDGLRIPVWHWVGGGEGTPTYNGSFLRETDLPEEVTEALRTWQTDVQVPFPGAVSRAVFEQFLLAHRFLALPPTADTIWQVASIEDEPEIQLADWSVREVYPARTRHFVGRNLQGKGRVSSAITAFDPVTRRGRTASGRIYALLGEPGFDADAEYVFRIWCAIPGRGADKQRDVTTETSSLGLGWRDSH